MLNCVYCTSVEYITRLCDLPEELDKPLRNVIILKDLEMHTNTLVQRGGILDLTCWVMDAAGGAQQLPRSAGEDLSCFFCVQEQNVNAFFWNARGYGGRF